MQVGAFEVGAGEVGTGEVGEGLDVVAIHLHALTLPNRHSRACCRAAPPYGEERPDAQGWMDRDNRSESRIDTSNRLIRHTSAAASEVETAHLRTYRVAFTQGSSYLIRTKGSSEPIAA